MPSTAIFQWPVPLWLLVKTIVIAGYLLNQITQMNFVGFGIETSDENDADCTLWLISDAFLCVTWLINWSNCRRCHGTNILTVVDYGSHSNSKMYLQKNYVPQTNLPIASVFTIRSNRGQSNAIIANGRVPCVSLARICKYDLLYLWTVEYGHC